MTKQHLKPGDLAPGIIVLDTTGQPIDLASQWSNGPTLLTFLRHFGWIFCREWLAQLELHKDEIEAAGLKIIAIGLGEPKHAKHYCGKLAPGITCLTDTRTESRFIYGLEPAGVKVMATAGLDIMKSTMRAVSKGHMQGQATGDVRMLPGTFIVDREGKIEYVYYSKHAGDHPEFADLIRAARLMKV